MPYKVLVVDDSSFFQHRLKEIINESPQLEVVGIASNGQEAIDKAKKLEPDVISMDYEMPLLDGVSAVRAILAERPVPIVMFSSLTYEGAKITLQALDAGAVDFIPKNFAEVSSRTASLKKKLHDTLITFASKAKAAPARSTEELAAEASERSLRAKQKTAELRERMAKKRPQRAATPTASRASMSKNNLKGKVKLVAIGSSTGGPVALSDIITELPGDFPAPILIVQHMPENFTRAFAERLDRLCALKIKQAETGDRIEAGVVYLAPGGKQMILDRDGHTIKIIAGDDRVNYKPCVDITFASIANTYKGKVLAMMLTGMGADGCDGTRLLKEKGATVWAQDEDSSVVYGMPQAVAKANLTDEILSLADLGDRLRSDL